MDPQVQQQLMIWGGAMPAGVAIVLLLIFWSIHTRRAMWVEDESGDETIAKSGPVWLLPMLIVVGFLGAFSAQFPSFQWWPADNSYRLSHAMILVGVLGVLEGVVRLSVPLAFVLRVVVFAGVFWLLASGYRASEVVFADDWAYFGWWAVAALMPALLATLHEQSSEKVFGGVPGWVDAGCWMVVFGGMMPSVFFNGSATGSTVLPGVLAVLGAAAVVGLICKPMTISRGGITVLICVVLVVMIGSSVHSELRSLPAMILMLGAVCTGILRFDGKSVFKYVLVRVGIAAVLLGGAAALSYHEHDVIENGGAVDGEVDPYADY